MNHYIIYEEHSGVGVVWLNCPAKRNALTAGMLARLERFSVKLPNRKICVR